MKDDVKRALERAAGGALLGAEDAFLLGELSLEETPALMEVSAARRSRLHRARLTYSPKVFLPLTNLCRNRCDYCSFRRSPGDAEEWTMSPEELGEWFARAESQGCVEALFCLGDTPETGFREYRDLLRGWGHENTVEYLHWAGALALEHGLLPHTNAGILSVEEMARLREVNVSLGLMLENVSPRLCEKGMPHHQAPDKRPHKRIGMTREAGALSIPFTSGLLLGIGETKRERVETLLAIRELHHEHGHIQEIIVQNFRARPEIVMADAPEPAEWEVAHAIALARLILDDEVSVQAPPNLNPASTELLIRAGINDFGGVSPVSPDYINPGHPWPMLDALGEACASAGFELRPRLPIYDAYLKRPGFLHEPLREKVEAAARRLAEVEAPEDLSKRSPGPEAGAMRSA